MIKLFEEVGEPSRRSLLIEMLSGPKTVTELCKATSLKQANVSNHLARLRRKHVVHREKKGREAFYRIASPEMTEALSSLVPDAAERADTLDLIALSNLYVRAGLNGDEYTCSKIVDRAIRAGLTLVSIDEDLLGSALVTVGSILERGECDEAQKHLIYFITERMVARVAMVRQSFARIDRTALLGCAPGPHHSLGLRMVADYLKSVGWQTLFLGDAVPNPTFQKQLESHGPDLVILDFKGNSPIEGALELIEVVANGRRNGLTCSLGLGGQGAVEHSRELLGAGVDFIAHSLREFAYEVLPNLDFQVRSGAAHYLQ